MTEGACPSCGAPVAFTAGTAQVLVCAHCQTVVGRKGKALEDRGRVAAILDTDTPFQLGATGRFRKEAFRFVGHLQKEQSHGGLWDEWAIELDSGAGAWLAESEGTLHLLRYVEDNPDVELPKLRPGVRVPIKELRFVVEEVGTARTVAAEGQLPSDLDPAQDHGFADLTGPNGVFATLDFGRGSRGAEVYAGSRVRLEELNIEASALRPRVKKAELVQARCTECNGPLELRAPDRTRRVACPYCGALLDASGGRLKFLQALAKPDFEPLIPLGAKGRFDGTEWVCIGFQRRRCTVEGTDYPWDEYLLFHRSRGFGWLMESTGHWSFVEGVPAGEVTTSLKSARFQDRDYRKFSHVSAITDYVLGEFYWEVNQGDEVWATEYVAPPRVLSEEQTSDEVTFSHGRYVEPAEVKKAFGIKSLPHPHGSSSCQPNPFGARATSAFAWAAIYAAALVVLFIVVSAMAPRQRVLTDRVTIPPEARAGAPELIHFSEPFEIQKQGNVAIELSATPLSNDWLGVQGDLVNEATGEVVSFYLEADYWFGRDSDGAWSEGSRTALEYVSAVPPGRYVLRATPAFSTAGKTYELTVTSGVPRVLWLVLGLVFLALWPTALAILAAMFENARWQESNVETDE